MNFKMLLSQQFGTPVRRLSQTLSVPEAPAAVRKLLALKSNSIVTVLDICAATSARPSSSAVRVHQNHVGSFFRNHDRGKGSRHDSRRSSAENLARGAAPRLDTNAAPLRA